MDIIMEDKIKTALKNLKPCYRVPSYIRGFLPR